FAEDALYPVRASDDRARDHISSNIQPALEIVEDSRSCIIRVLLLCPPGGRSLLCYFLPLFGCQSICACGAAFGLNRRGIVFLCCHSKLPIKMLASTIQGYASFSKHGYLCLLVYTPTPHQKAWATARSRTRRRGPQS